MRRVLLCGKSLFISGLQASLSGKVGLELRTVDTLPEHIRACLRDWQPEVMILEARLLKSAFPLSLLQDFPQLKLIGLEIEENRLLVFSGTSAQEPTPEYLLQVINA